MDLCTVKLTVCFEDPFWVGICERTWNGQYEACKITFGAEPKDCEVYDFMLKNSSQLKFSPSIPGEVCASRKLSPKRIQRAIRNEMRQSIGTKAQQALKLQKEQQKQERKVCSKENREQVSLRQFALRQEKRKAKHKGH